MAWPKQKGHFLKVRMLPASFMVNRGEYKSKCTLKIRHFKNCNNIKVRGFWEGFPTAGRAGGQKRESSRNVAALLINQNVESRHIWFSPADIFRPRNELNRKPLLKCWCAVRGHSECEITLLQSAGVGIRIKTSTCNIHAIGPDRPLSRQRPWLPICNALLIAVARSVTQLLKRVLKLTNKRTLKLWSLGFFGSLISNMWSNLTSEVVLEDKQLLRMSKMQKYVHTQEINKLPIKPQL